ncbi:Uncharacterized protein HZ326_30892 [Fusarium oxysporum f. sp. albedinis]|nr:Uncharacterized protein HZ326_30892 [Fusarium oxysporum f. sp. albedinis]
MFTSETTFHTMTVSLLNASTHPEMPYSRRLIAGQHHGAMPLLLEGPTKRRPGGLRLRSLAIEPVALQMHQ